MADEAYPFNDPVHGPPARPGARKRAAIMLLVATLFAAVICAIIFAAVFYADFDVLNGAAGEVMGFLFHHSAFAMALAASPLFAAMLVGYGYAQRAMRRRAAAKRA